MLWLEMDNNTCCQSCMSCRVDAGNDKELCSIISARLLVAIFLHLMFATLALLTEPLFCHKLVLVYVKFMLYFYLVPSVPGINSGSTVTLSRIRHPKMNESMNWQWRMHCLEVCRRFNTVANKTFKNWFSWPWPLTWFTAGIKISSIIYWGWRVNT